MIKQKQCVHGMTRLNILRLVSPGTSIPGITHVCGNFPGIPFGFIGISRSACYIHNLIAVCTRRPPATTASPLLKSISKNEGTNERKGKEETTCGRQIRLPCALIFTLSRHREIEFQNRRNFNIRPLRVWGLMERTG